MSHVNKIKVKKLPFWIVTTIGWGMNIFYTRKEAETWADNFAECSIEEVSLEK